MGWVWKDDDDEDERDYNSSSAEFRGSSGPSDGATRKVVRTQCRTEEVESGKFIRKCEKTKQVFRDCVGRPNELVESYKEYTEEDVTDQMVKGPSSFKPAEKEASFFPGLRSDVDAIERHLFSGIDSLFRAAEDMRSEFYNSVFAPHEQAPSSSIESFTKKKSDSDAGDLSRFASDV